MTTDQKLKLFISHAMEQAQLEQETQLKQYESSLKEELLQKKTQYQKERELVYQKKEAQLHIDINKKIANETTQQRLDTSAQKETFMQMLFEEVQKRIHFLKTQDQYMEILKEQILSIQALAGSDSCKIYLDASDRSFIPTLEKVTKANLVIAKHNLIGGTLAKIPNQNLLIDETIQTKLMEVKESFSLFDKVPIATETKP